MKKECKKCKVEKSIADFIKMGMYRHTMCDPCRKEYVNDNNKRITRLKNESKW